MCDCVAYLFIFLLHLLRAQCRSAAVMFGGVCPRASFSYGLCGVTFLWYLCHPSIRVTRKGLVFQVEQHAFESLYAVFQCCRFRPPFVACVYNLSE